MRILVEVSQGLGDCIQGTPLCEALRLLGHEVDLFVFSNAGKAAAKLFNDWPAVTRIFTNRKEFDERDYDFACSCYGRRELVRRFPAGRFCIIRSTIFSSATGIPAALSGRR